MAFPVHWLSHGSHEVAAHAPRHNYSGFSKLERLWSSFELATITTGNGATQQETSFAAVAPHSPKPDSDLLVFLLLEHDVLICFASDLPFGSGLHC
eukprot:s992_g9.t1